MKSSSYLLGEPSEIDDIIARADVRCDGTLLCLIHTPIFSESEIFQIIAKLEVAYPGCQIAGTTTSHAIYYGKIYDDKCLIEFIEARQTDIQVETFDQVNNTPALLGEKAAEFMITPKTCVMMAFFTNGYGNIDDFLRSFNARTPHNLKVTGGLCGSNRSGENFVFTNHGIAHDSLLCVSFHNPEIYTYADSFTGMEVVHECYEMTDVDGTYVNEIDGYPAADWLKSIFGVNNLSTVDYLSVSADENVLFRFPIEFDSSRGIAHLFNVEEDTGRVLVYNYHPPIGSKFRLAFINSETIADRCVKACADLSRTPIEVCFCYSCILRMVLAGNSAEWELSPFIKAGISGALMMGEIGAVDDLGKPSALTEACCILTVAENRRYVSVNAGSLKLRRFSDEAHRDTWNHILRFQNKSIADKNTILQSAVSNLEERRAETLLYRDAATGRPNLKRLMKDCDETDINKACLVTVEKGNMASAHFGEEVFARIIQRNIIKFEKYLDIHFAELSAVIYAFDETSFIITAKKSAKAMDFLCAMQELFIKFGTINIINLSYTCIHRFISIKNEGSNLIESLKICYNRNANNPDRFIVYESDEKYEDTMDDAFKKTKLLTEAIENDSIVPYFQPIYDNDTERIEKFEALIRIKGADGRLYFPGQFLESAKEYRLYLQISSIMINKVFDLFENRKESVSINLSAYDINSSSVRNMIYRRLERIGDCSHFIFEVLESEEFRDFEVLTKFIEKVRRYGVKIAIDDFGAGFSNLLEIAKISPNFIKIDGQIVREVVESEMHRKIMDAIIELAKSFEIEVIAEFIENAALQNYSQSKGVRYSQGYFFSPPIPYNELDDFMKKYNTTDNEKIEV
ncbi:MAG: EAL domain-containing protein [Ruminococcus sp.]|jgi:EAL domain-containing protein (putative c-di-GMP-specific phosphodiesterase class I)|nr:EAL domain-containing protein [Ruminococcus sp.]